MKSLIFCCLIFFCIDAKSQSKCDDKIGYDKKDGNLVCVHTLKGFISDNDTSIRVGLFAKLIKNYGKNQILIYGLFDRNIGIIDPSTKVKFIFHDGSSFVLNKGAQDSNDIGFFDTPITDKYDLLIMKTKSITGIEITGDRLNAMTYKVDFFLGMTFMLDMDCIEQYL